MKAVVKQAVFARVPLKGRQEQAMRTMIRGIGKMQESQVRFWIGCGTFLGLYRDGKFIDIDLDIDISASMDWNEGYKEGEKRIMDAFNSLGWRLIRQIHVEGRVCQIAFMSDEDVIFDITFYYTGIKEGMLVSYSDVGVVEEPEHLFHGFIPYPSEEYLEYRYGDWKTPDSEFRPWNTYCKSIV